MRKIKFFNFSIFYTMFEAFYSIKCKDIEEKALFDSFESKLTQIFGKLYFWSADIDFYNKYNTIEN